MRIGGVATTITWAGTRTNTSNPDENRQKLPIQYCKIHEHITSSSKVAQSRSFNLFASFASFKNLRAQVRSRTLHSFEKGGDKRTIQCRNTACYLLCRRQGLEYCQIAGQKRKGNTFSFKQLSKTFTVIARVRLNIFAHDVNQLVKFFLQGRWAIQKLLCHAICHAQRKFANQKMSPSIKLFLCSFTFKNIYS